VPYGALPRPRGRAAFGYSGLPIKFPPHFPGQPVEHIHDAELAEAKVSTQRDHVTSLIFQARLVDELSTSVEVLSEYA
jgi:hypothetical protein